MTGKPKYNLYIPGMGHWPVDAATDYDAIRICLPKERGGLLTDINGRVVCDGMTSLSASLPVDMSLEIGPVLREPPPRFLVLEGIDGSGTTTQSSRLAERLRDRGHRVLETREPSRGPIGAMTRQMLAAGSATTVGPEALALLFAADRLEHLAREIEPALARGELVICDRYLVSSWVYQALDCDPIWVRTINRHARWPDRTFVFALPAELALARVAARRAASGEPIERFDEADTQRRLAEGYAKVLADGNCDTIPQAGQRLMVGLAPAQNHGLIEIDATAAIERVTDAILGRCIAMGL